VDRRTALSVMTSVVVGGGLLQDAGAVPPATKCDHIAWVSRVLERMKGVKRGMKRSDLLSVFTTEGGLSTGLQRTFVSQECPYFKVDVTFRAVGRPDKDREGRVTLTEGPLDEILSISPPYIAYSVTD
jgi:hypothetical protein